MIVKLLTEQHLEYLSLKGGCRGSSESTHVKLPHCWKSHALAHFLTEFVSEEIVAVLAISFNSYFNQIGLEVGIKSSYSAFWLNTLII